MRDARTGISVSFWMTISADVGEARNSALTDCREVVLDAFLAIISISTEPGNVSGRGAPDEFDVRVSAIGVEVGVGGSGANKRLLVRRAASKLGIPLVVGTPGDSKNIGKLDLSDILNGRVDIIEGTIGIDVGEEVRRFDGVVSSTRPSEIVRSRHWW